MATGSTTVPTSSIWSTISFVRMIDQNITHEDDKLHREAEGTTKISDANQFHQILS